MSQKLIELTIKLAENHPMVVDAQSKYNALVAMGHVGTHIDVCSGRAIPLEYHASNGVLFDVRGISEITENDIDLSCVSAGDFVIFRTGKMENNEYGSSSYFACDPVLSHDLIAKLIELKVHFIGIDASGIRSGSEHHKADVLCENNGVYVVENLSNLSAITSKNFTVYAMWVDNAKLNGISCRILVEQ